MSLIELVVATGLGTLVLGSVGTLFIYGLFSFAGLGNYAILSGQSKLSLDMMSRDVREMTALTDYQNTISNKSLTFTNAYEASTVKFMWDSSTGILKYQKTSQPDRVLLTGCNQWNVNLYQRSPQTNWVFYTTTNLDTAKLINMNWKCSRTILGRRINKENVVTAQIVLRNKP